MWEPGERRGLGRFNSTEYDDRDDDGGNKRPAVDQDNSPTAPFYTTRSYQSSPLTGWSATV